jgi:hypothetical protein
MDHRWEGLRRATADAVLRREGATAPQLRQALARGEAPAELKRLVDLIRREPYRVADEDIAGLRARYSEDQLFEIVVATALGAADERLEAALAALRTVVPS